MCSRSVESLSTYPLVDRDWRVHENARFVGYARLLLFVISRGFLQVVDLGLHKLVLTITTGNMPTYLRQRRTNGCDEEAVTTLATLVTFTTLHMIDSISTYLECIWSYDRIGTAMVSYLILDDSP